MTHEELKAATRVLFTVIGRVEDDMHVAIGDLSPEQEAAEHNAAMQAMADGLTVRWPDGTETWRDVSPVFHPGRPGSDAYEWSHDGERVKHTIRHVTRHPDGRIERRTVRHSWRRLA